MKEWVSQWWQYPKYGLLYQVNNGSVGFRFNDGTIVHHTNKKWIYFDENGKKMIIKVSELKDIQNFNQILSKIKVMNSIIEKKGFKK